MKSSSVLWTSFILQMKQSFARPMFKYVMLVSPFLSSVILGEIYRYAGRGDEYFLSYVVLGSGLWSLWGSIIFSSIGDINRERFTNTLSIIFSSPTDFRIIWLGKILGNTFLSVISFFISVLFSSILYGITISFNNFGFVLLSLLITIVSFIIISISTSYLLTLSRKTTLFMNCLEFPFMLLFGFAFPVSMLPTPIMYFSYIFPITWVIKLLRSSFSENLENFGYYLSFSILTIVLFIFISHLLYKIIYKQTKILGTLDMV
ncbi:MAG: ABC transporter permease [Defluviitaleaceae bacterium]|nr:ABC transporter permease [Defluviitaleaceae bacterium]